MKWSENVSLKSSHPPTGGKARETPVGGGGAGMKGAGYFRLGQVLVKFFNLFVSNVKCEC